MCRRACSGYTSSNALIEKPRTISFQQNPAGRALSKVISVGGIWIEEGNSNGKILKCNSMCGS